MGPWGRSMYMYQLKFGVVLGHADTLASYYLSKDVSFAFWLFSLMILVQKKWQSRWPWKTTCALFKVHLVRGRLALLFPPMVQVEETVYQSRPPLSSGTAGELAMKKCREEMS